MGEGEVINPIVLWSAVGALAAVAAFGIVFATFWAKSGATLASTAAAAAAAKEIAQSAFNKAELLAAALSNHRETTSAQAARLEALVESCAKNFGQSEQRLTLAIEKMTDRFDTFTREVSRRIDDVGNRIAEIATAKGAEKQ
jgi:hypothetical protein